MVYISGDGTVCNTPPWSFNRLINLFYGLIAFVVFFFKSMFGMDTSTSKPGSSAGSGGSLFRGSGGGGGGRPFGPGGGGGGGGSNKRFRTMRDINPPTVNAGGCPGGSCGM